MTSLARLVSITSLSFMIACGSSSTESTTPAVDTTKSMEAPQPLVDGVAEEPVAVVPVKAVKRPAMGSSSGAEFAAMQAVTIDSDLLKRGVDPSQVSTNGIPAPLRGFGNVKQTGFRVVYSESSDPLHEQLREAFHKELAFEFLAHELNRTLKLDRVVDIQMVDCNTADAFYDPNNKRIIVCYELASYLLSVFQPTAASEHDLAAAVVGSAFFAVFHQLGHALIDVFDLPAVGSVEDVVDQMAALIVMNAGDDGVHMALAGAESFLVHAPKNAELGKNPFWDEHSLDEQRFTNIACLAYGSNVDAFAKLVSDERLSDERASRCVDEYESISRAWSPLLEPHMREEVDPTSVAAGTTGCDAVAAKIVDLVVIRMRAEMVAAGATKAEINLGEKALLDQIPTILNNLVEACVSERWSESDRQCVMGAASIAEAERCGK